MGRLTPMIERLPKKGLTGRWPLRPHPGSRRAPWIVMANLHEEALSYGFLTGALFTQRSVRGTKFKLVLVGQCPWEKRNLRYYPLNLTEEEAESLARSPHAR